MRTFNSLWKKFQRAAYRKAFVGAEVKRTIPFQISALRKSRGWSQEQLARLSGLTQGVISRAEDPDYGNLTFNTIIKIANGFDVGFVGKFVCYSELAEWYTGLTEASAGDVPSFEDENVPATQNPAAATLDVTMIPEAPTPIVTTFQVPPQSSGCDVVFSYGESKLFVEAKDYLTAGNTWVPNPAIDMPIRTDVPVATLEANIEGEFQPSLSLIRQYNRSIREGRDAN